MDDLDQRILGVLQEDGRASNAAVARRLGVSEGTVRRRIKLLVRQGVMQVTAVPDLKATGQDAVALIGIQTDPNAVEEVASRLTALPDVHFVSITTGAYDVFATVALRSPEEVHAFLHRHVASISGVRHTETFLNLSIRKRIVRAPNIAPEVQTARRRRRSKQ